jgi:membrane dipeptidase
MTTPTAISEASRALYESAIVIDALGGSIVRRPPPDVEGLDAIGQRIQAGITVSNETLAADREDFRAATALIYDYLTLASVERQRLMIIESVADIECAKREGRHGVILGFQGATALEDDVSTVFLFQKLGVRIIGLAYNGRTEVGDGCYESQDLGLTVHGRRVVNAMNEAGITVDLSHVGERTSLEAIEVSARPAIFSHSNCRALTPHVRNISDEQIRAVASKGGVVGIGPHSVFCERTPGQRPSIGDFIDHFEHVINLVGIDHVGIGTDMFGGETLSERLFRAKFSRVVPSFFAGYSIAEKYVTGFERVSQFQRLVDEFAARGFADGDIRKILGGNFIRVFAETWSAR